jgi:hypothetical protein
MRTSSKRGLSFVLALGAALVVGVSAFASSTYYDNIIGGELPNATTTEGRFSGTASGSLPGGWYIDVRHQVLSGNSTPVYMTGGSFKLETAINFWPATVYGSFVPWGGTVTQTSGFSGCSNQTYRVSGALSGVGVNGGGGSGYFSATLTHFRAWVWWVGCVTYSASVSGSVSMTF